MDFGQRLTPTTQHKSKYRILGFDVETYDRNKNFLCASIIGKDCKIFYTNRKDFINILRQPYFKNTIVCATNLTFDFFQLFFEEIEIIKSINPLFRGSDLLSVITYLHNGEFYKTRVDKSAGKIYFLDTLNYVRLSVEKFGGILGLPKLEKPSFLGEYPKNDEEWEYIKEYNIRDSEVTYKSMTFLMESFYKLGATFRPTIASTAMSVFRNKYLKETYYRHEIPVLDDIFESYYGGRTEAFKRGYFTDYNYYDFNSLYPSVMKYNVYPNPNTIRSIFTNTLDYIKEYEGVSNVDIECPYMKYPILPYKFMNKLFFPIGTFSGWYTHVELREAMKLGYKILNVNKTHYYKETCTPFNEYVTDLYAKRQKYKKEGSTMELVTKLLLNSLYGKFGQKFRDKDNVIPFTHSADELKRYKYVETIGNGYFLRVVEDREPAGYCIPIWASYVTAYGRIKLHKYIQKCNPLYADTDSIITKSYFPDSTLLGDLKLEKRIKQGIIVKPKFYYTETYDGESDAKAKGVGMKLTVADFRNLIDTKTIKYTKFLKPRECFRRNLEKPGLLMDVEKTFSLEDTKRFWNDKLFDPTKLQSSEPVKFDNGDLIDLKYKRLIATIKMTKDHY